MGTPAITVDELRQIDLFFGLSDEELAGWLDVTLPYEAFPGEQIAEDNASDQGVQLLISGTARNLLVRGDRIEPGGRQHGPTWMGAIATLTGTPTGARIQAETHCRLGAIGASAFRELALSQPIVHRRVMEAIAPVMTKISAIDQNRDRLASLGTMAAGLAHELNNPAAAAQRAASQMDDALGVLNHTLRKFIEAGVTLETARKMLALHDEVVDAASSRTALDALDAADAEDDVLDALEDASVPEAWRYAEPLASIGADAAWVARVSEAAAGDAAVVSATVAWVAASATAGGLADELKESTRRMTDLVGAVKSYTYMDRGELQELDLHEGIETTIKVLGHKLKQTHIEIVRDYDRSLPKLTARGPELTQVWTNLIDNAVDALGNDGTLTITTRLDNGCARIEFTDDGPGIPADIAPRVFESFFTTKDVGKGTGLGLATAHRIVADRHGGSLIVESEPGRTTFSVWLPFQGALAAGADDAGADTTTT
ncbi:MAG: histidine kinase [Solirubrobacteraceae bacterium]|nr:histidine kinase [Solirubrobacteraceae bacterium]